MKLKYTNPKIELVVVEIEDVIMASAFEQVGDHTFGFDTFDWQSNSSFK